MMYTYSTQQSSKYFLVAQHLFTPFQSCMHVCMTVLLRSVQRRIGLWRFADWITQLCLSKMSSDHAVFTVRNLEWRNCPFQAIYPSLEPGFEGNLQSYTCSLRLCLDDLPRANL